MRLVVLWGVGLAAIVGCGDGAQAPVSASSGGTAGSIAGEAGEAIEPASAGVAGSAGARPVEPSPAAAGDGGTESVNAGRGAGGSGRTSSAGRSNSSGEAGKVAASGGAESPAGSAGEAGEVTSGAAGAPAPEPEDPVKPSPDVRYCTNSPFSPSGCTGDAEAFAHERCDPITSSRLANPNWDFSLCTITQVMFFELNNFCQVEARCPGGDPTLGFESAGPPWVPPENPECAPLEVPGCSVEFNEMVTYSDTQVTGCLWKVECNVASFNVCYPKENAAVPSDASEPLSCRWDACRFADSTPELNVTVWTCGTLAK